MAIKGYGVHFELLVDGAPYGQSTESTAWTKGTNIDIYCYIPTIDGSGTITNASDYACRNASGGTPAITPDVNGQAYWANMPAMRASMVLDLQDGNNWDWFPHYRDMLIGFPEPFYCLITGDGTSGPFNLNLAGGADALGNTSVKPFQSDIHVLYMGRTYMEPTNSYTTALATAQPTVTTTWDNSDAAHTNSLTIVQTPRSRGDKTILRTTEHLVVTGHYLPGGGY